MRSQPRALEVTTHLDHKHSYKELLSYRTEDTGQRSPKAAISDLLSRSIWLWSFSFGGGEKTRDYLVHKECAIDCKKELVLQMLLPVGVDGGGEQGERHLKYGKLQVAPEKKQAELLGSAMEIRVYRKQAEVLGSSMEIRVYRKQTELLGSSMGIRVYRKQTELLESSMEIRVYWQLLPCFKTDSNISSPIRRSHAHALGFLVDAF
jgi:hypothetical protein